MATARCYSTSERRAQLWALVAMLVIAIVVVAGTVTAAVHRGGLAPSRYHVVRQCRDGASWLKRDQYGNYRITDLEWMSEPVDARDVSAACP